MLRAQQHNCVRPEKAAVLTSHLVAIGAAVLFQEGCLGLFIALLLLLLLWLLVGADTAAAAAVLHSLPRAELRRGGRGC